MSVTPVANLTSSAVVVIVRVPVTVVAPAPFCVTAPSALMFAFTVSSPAFVNITTPLLVVVITPFCVMLFVVRFTPVAVFVFTAPVSSVSPVPALCTKEAAVKPALSVTSFALVIVTAPNRFVPPTAPVNSTLEPAAVTPSVWPVALSTVLWNVTSPVPAPVPAVAIVTGRLSVTARRKFTSSAVVVIVRVPAPPNATAPAPFCVTAPSAPMLPLMFSTPAFVKAIVALLVVVRPLPAKSIVPPVVNLILCELDTARSVAIVMPPVFVPVPTLIFAALILPMNVLVRLTFLVASSTASVLPGDSVSIVKIEATTAPGLFAAVSVSVTMLTGFAPAS